MEIELNSLIVFSVLNFNWQSCGNKLVWQHKYNYICLCKALFRLCYNMVKPFPMFKHGWMQSDESLCQSKVSANSSYFVNPFESEKVQNVFTNCCIIMSVLYCNQEHFRNSIPSMPNMRFHEELHICSKDRKKRGKKNCH